MKVLALKSSVFLLSSLPAAKLLADAFGIGGGSLGANPVESLLHRAGWWGLVFLLITLAVTPVRDLSGWKILVRVRRMLGLFAFFYVSVHFSTYAVLDQGLALGPIIDDVFKRPYITVGMAALALLIPLALTSNNFSLRRLKKRWQTLHKLVYPIAILGVWHFWWQVKKDVSEPLIFAGILSLLLGYRLFRWRQRAGRQRAG
ncbi:MAG: sulfite oxidase heme-binding subunit YedZ [Gammaproteobacteria bacterium]